MRTHTALWALTLSPLVLSLVGCRGSTLSSECVGSTCPPPTPSADPNTGGGDVVGAQREGVATFYDEADGTGACDYPKGYSGTAVTAVSPSQFAGGNACGSCWSVTGPSGTTVVRVVDLCANCSLSTHFDLHPSAFLRVAPNREIGRVNVKATQVSCPVSAGPKLRLKDGVNPWWLSVQVLNHSWPIARIESQDAKSGNWNAFAYKGHGFYEAKGSPPWKIRVTNSKGATASVTLEEKDLKDFAELTLSGSL